MANVVSSTYVSSENIQIFPIANRGAKDPLGRLTTEYNLTSILNKLLDVNGFVISWDNNSKNIVFNLHGYLITANLTDIINDFSDNIYAYIGITDYINGANDYEKKFLAQLGGGDVSSEDTTIDDYGKYNGVLFRSDDIKPSLISKSYNLHLLTKVNNEWVIPEDSKIKFRTNESCRSISIDDGIL